VGLVLLCCTVCIPFLLQGSSSSAEGGVRADENSVKAVVFLFGYGVSTWVLIQPILAVAYLYCYEVTPIRFRVPAVLGVALMETLGSYAVGLAQEFIVSNVEPIAKETLEEMYEPQYVDEAQAYYLAIAQRYALFEPISIAVWAMLGATILVGLLAVRRDTPIHLVNRGEAGLVYDRLVADGTENSKERVPMTRDEFLVNSGKEAEQALNFAGVVKRAVSPMALLALLLLSMTIMDRSVLTAYHYLMVEILGLPDGGSVANPVPGDAIRHGLAMVGIIGSLGLWAWCKDIRFAPALAVIITAVGSIICASVSAFDENDLYKQVGELSSTLSVCVGVSVIYLGLPLLGALLRVLIMDMFTNKSRAVGVLGMKAVELVWIGLVNIAYMKLRMFSWFYVTNAVIVAVIGGVALGAFYCTKWFDHCLICRDPELDACWLVSDKVADGQIIGSRDRLRPSLTGRSG